MLKYLTMNKLRIYIDSTFQNHTLAKYILGPNRPYMTDNLTETVKQGSALIYPYNLTQRAF